MSEEWIKYVDDHRKICKYGSKCYQKNPQHLSKFKHPPHSKRKLEKDHHTEKRIKLQAGISHHQCGIVLGDSNKEEETEQTRVDFSKQSVDSVYTESPENLSDSQSHTEDQSTSQCPTPNLKTNISFVKADMGYEKVIKKLFLVNMPKDFYSFWKFICKENESSTDILEMVNLETVGAFDVLTGKLPEVENKDHYLVHWRFFYDPPEFQTVIKVTGKSELHIGYFRDSPEDEPVFIASNDSSKNCTITPLAYNIFGALYLYLQSEKKKSPFAATTCQKVMDKLKLWAEENNFTLDKFDTRNRLATVAVTRTFHGAGIVVPYDKKTQLGYRTLAESDAAIKKMLANLSSADSDEKKNRILSELQPVITYANIAMDECDFGTGLELGIDLFCSGLAELNAITLAALTTAYTLLNRHEFVKIIQTHLQYRRKGADMSVLSIM